MQEQELQAHVSNPAVAVDARHAQRNALGLVGFRTPPLNDVLRVERPADARKARGGAPVAGHGRVRVRDDARRHREHGRAAAPRGRVREDWRVPVAKRAGGGPLRTTLVGRGGGERGARSTEGRELIPPGAVHCLEATRHDSPRLVLAQCRPLHRLAAAGHDPRVREARVGPRVAVRDEVGVGDEVAVRRESPRGHEVAGTRDRRCRSGLRWAGGVGAVDGPGIAARPEARGGVCVAVPAGRHGEVLEKAGVFLVEVVEGVADGLRGLSLAVLALLHADDTRQLGGVQRGRSPR